MDGFCALSVAGYEQWVVVEKDRVITDPAEFEDASAGRPRNRDWREHAGW